MFKDFIYLKQKITNKNILFSNNKVNAFLKIETTTNGLIINECKMFKNVFRN